jgi:hypothetical protein
MTLHENKNRYNEKPNLSFLVNDMLNTNREILTLQLRSKMQYFTKCAKIMIKVQRQRYQPMKKFLFFCIFNKK